MHDLVIWLIVYFMANLNIHVQLIASGFNNNRKKYTGDNRQVVVNQWNKNIIWSTNFLFLQDKSVY